MSDEHTIYAMHVKQIINLQAELAQALSDKEQYKLAAFENAEEMERLRCEIKRLRAAIEGISA
jgi:hypothetical protein